MKEGLRRGVVGSMVLAAGLVAGLKACAQAKTAEPVYSISGVVVNARDGGPVPGCRVWVTAAGATVARRPGMAGVVGRAGMAGMAGATRPAPPQVPFGGGGGPGGSEQRFIVPRMPAADNGRNQVVADGGGST